MPVNEQQCAQQCAQPTNLLQQVFHGRRAFQRLPVMASICMFLAACQPIAAPPPGPDGRDPARLSPLTTPIAIEEEIMSRPIPTDNRQVISALKDLARRLAVDLETIKVVSAEAVQWPDAGLGCPRPGMAYIQVPQDGMRIVLAAGGREYNYHSGRGRPPFLCESEDAKK
jgi:hypothetical protein